MGDAASLEIRPIVPEDKAQLAQAFDGLSEESRYRRFLTPRGRLSDAELRYFTEVDHHDHEALVAVDPKTLAGIGVARYIRSPTDPSLAEVAVAVVDDWQGRGVGTRLATALAERAREEGITAFTALALAENDAMLNLLSDLGPVHVLNRDGATIEVRADLPEPGLTSRLRRLLAAAACGEIVPVPVRTGALARVPRPPLNR